MISSDSIPSIPMASSNPKDFAKKKRANRSAKLKQCKLDARREQWLSQVKNKGGCKEEVSCGKEAPKVPPPVQIEKLEIKQRGSEEVYGDEMSMNHFSDSDFSPSNSPTSHASSALGSSGSGVNFTASSSSGSSRSSSSSSNGCYSESLSDEEDEGGVGDDEDDDADWEAFADALAASENKKQTDESEKHGSDQQSSAQLDAVNQTCASGVDPKSESGGTAAHRASVKGQAWRPDDVCRPQCLPNLSKQYSFPLNSERHFARGGSVWGRASGGPIPTSCPICCEDLDCTDSSFLPCLCGFRLCLFCHKKILEQDARCPGCRKQYECEPVEREATFDGGSLTVRLARSCSMMTRS